MLLLVIMQLITFIFEILVFSLRINKNKLNFLNFLQLNLRVVKMIGFYLMTTTGSITSASIMFWNASGNSQSSSLSLSSSCLGSFGRSHCAFTTICLRHSTTFSLHFFHIWIKLFLHWNCFWSIWSLNKHFQNLRLLSIFSSPIPSKLIDESFGLPRILIIFWYWFLTSSPPSRYFQAESCFPL